MDGQTQIFMGRSVREKECIGTPQLDRWGPTGDEGYIRSPMPSPSQRQTGGVSQMSPAPLLDDHTLQPRQPLGEIWMTEVERMVNDSNVVLAFSHHISFIHTSSSDEQCIHKSTREKYWFYTIHFLKYIQSKISYVSIMSGSQSAPVCNYMHCVCERTPESPIYITQSRVSKGSYLFGLRVSFAWRPAAGALEADR